MPEAFIDDASESDSIEMRRLYDDLLISSKDLLRFPDSEATRSRFESKGGFIEDDGTDLDFEGRFFAPLGIVKVVRTNERITGFTSTTLDAELVTEQCRQDFGWRAGQKYACEEDLPIKSESGKLTWTDTKGAIEFFQSVTGRPCCYGSRDIRAWADIAVIPIPRVRS